MAFDGLLVWASLTAQRLDLELAKIPWLNALQVKYKVPRLAVFAFASAGAFSFLFLGVGASLFTTLLGCAYPTYASFKAIESTSKQDDTQWLTYWVIFALFSMLETCVDFILTWIPFYYAVKVAFLLYCQLPMFRGAEFLYRQFVRPVFLRHQAKIEEQFSRLSGARTALANVIGVDPLASPSITVGATDPSTVGHDEPISSIFGSHTHHSGTAPSLGSLGGSAQSTPGSAGSGKKE